VFSVRYELNSYILFRRRSALRGYSVDLCYCNGFIRVRFELDWFEYISVMNFYKV
jgi:hypothetical protein